jgi:signal transduction histidine kinase
MLAPSREGARAGVVAPSTARKLRSRSDPRADHVYIARKMVERIRDSEDGLADAGGAAARRRGRADAARGATRPPATPREARPHDRAEAAGRADVAVEARPRGWWCTWNWLPVPEQAVIEEFSLQGRPLRFLVSLIAVWGIFALPIVQRVTGISFKNILIVWAVMGVWSGVVQRRLHRVAARSRLAFYVLIFGSVINGTFITLSFPVMAGRPDTPLWFAFVLMTCIHGAVEAEASLLMNIIHAVAPLATIPIFLGHGCSPEQAIVWPVVVAAASSYGYRFLTKRRQHWRRDRHEREIALARQRLAESEKERERLSRDLHDTVGTGLSLVALYGTLAENRADDPGEARRLAGMIRDASRAALVELRGVLHALPQSPSPLQEIAAGLSRLARRSAEPAGVAVTMEVESGGSVVLGGVLRTALVRVFQEAVHNAIRHGRATEIRASLAAEGEQVQLSVVDNGAGFDPSLQKSGSGITGMRERARELGGDITVESVPGMGARLRLQLPLGSHRAALQ